MRVLVTGGAGFIGTNLTRALLAEGNDVAIIDDFSSGHLENLDDLEVDVLRGSILDRGLLDAAMAAADAVVHLAAQPSVPMSVEDPIGCHEVNVTGTLLVLEAARAAGTSQVIVASSAAVYGPDGSGRRSETMAPNPASPYAASKLAAEAYTTTYHHCYGMTTLALRFFNVYGPFQRAGHAYDSVIPAFVRAAVAGEPLCVHGDGLQSRDFISVGSVVDVIVTALRERLGAPHPVNVALGGRGTLLDVIAELEHILGRPLEVEHVDPRPGDVRESQADVSMMHALFPGATGVPLSVGLRETVAWYQHFAAADMA